MNVHIISGRLTRDPEVRFSQTGKTVTSFTVAVRRDYKNQAGEYESDFFNVKCFGKTAELVGNNLNKGQMVYVSGSTHINSFDGRDGTKKYYTELVVRNVEWQWPAKDSQQKGNNAGSYNNPANFDDFERARTEKYGTVSENEHVPFAFDEEIPF